MAAVAIALDDAATPPVNHNHVPLGPDRDGVFWWEDQAHASPIGFWKISMTLKRPPVAVAGSTSQQRTYRATIGVHEPVLENISNSTVSGIAPAPTVSYVPRCFMEFVMPERTALVDRQTLRKISMNLLANFQSVALVETLILPY